VIAVQTRETEKVILAEKEKLDKEKKKEEKVITKAIKETLIVKEKCRMVE
jgi:hypothetical protein